MLLFRLFMPFILIATIISIVGGIFVMSGGLSNPKDDPAALCKDGLQLALRTEYLPALRDFDKAIVIDRNYARAYVGRAQVLTVLADFIGAADNCNQAIALDPKFAAAYANRCVAFYWMGEYQKSLDDALTCQKLSDPAAKPAVLLTLGLAQLGMKDYAQALKNCNESMALLPNSPNAYSVRARIELAQKQYEPAIADCNKSLSVASRQAHVYDTRAAAYEGLGKTQLADADRKQSQAILDQDAAIVAEYKRTPR
ncbi:MAG TPA: hypothetical protein V6D22_11785 [Candidatus Obscuribacterales bacterium]